MSYECEHCGKKLQNPQALKMHIKWKHSSEATESKDSKSEEVIKPLKNNSHQDGSISLPVSEPSDDLEIEEAEDHKNSLETPKETEGLNYCPECNCQLKDYENPCPSCNAVIE